MESTLQEIWQNYFAALTWTQVGIATGLIFGSIILRNLLTKALLIPFENMLSKNAEKHHLILKIFSRPFSLSIVIGGVYLATVVMTLPKSVNVFFQHVLSTLITFVIFWTLFRAITPIADVLGEKGKAKSNRFTDDLKELFSTLLKTIVVVVGVLTILQSWNIQVAAFLAGLGLVGMAVALAAQDTMKNFFGSIAVFLDQTFKKGDWIRTPDVEGIVERIGLRTTSIRQFDKALVVVPNVKLADSAVINFTRMTNRRVRWIIGLTYSTTADQLQIIVKRIRQFLENDPDIETDPKRVLTIIRVDKFSDSSIDLFCYFFTKTTKWVEYMEVKEKCVLAFKRIIEEEGASFAFPSRTLHVERPATLSEHETEHMLEFDHKK